MAIAPPRLHRLQTNIRVVASAMGCGKKQPTHYFWMPHIEKTTMPTLKGEEEN